MKLIDIFQKLDESSVNEVHSHDDDYEDCDACNGTGEGRWEGETCHACHGSGVQKPEHDDDDFDIPDDDDFDGGDEESYYEKSLRSRGLEEQGVAEGLPQTLRKVVPGYAKREIDKKMDAGKFGKTDADKDANFQRYKKIQDKIKEQGVAEGEQQKGADYRDPPEADYGDDYQAMVARVKKLAGLGPLKTVWDPQKRVYKNVPTAVQPKK